MDYIDNEPIQDDFDDFDDITPNNNQTNKKSDLDDLESIKSEENLSPKAVQKNSKAKNEYLNSYNKSLNDSGAKPDQGKTGKNNEFGGKKVEDDTLNGSFDDNFEDKSFDDNKLDHVKRSEINDDSFLEKEKQAMKPGQIKKQNNGKNKENTKPSAINSKQNLKPTTKSNFKKNDIKNIQITPVIKKNAEPKKKSNKNSINANNGNGQAFNLVDNKLSVYKASQVKTKPQQAVKPQVFSLIAVAEENKQLFEELKSVNDKLTNLIEEKGYQNQLDKIRENNTEFKYRPVNVKIITFDKEIKNNQKIIEVLNRELGLYKDTVKKLDSTELLNDLNRRITNYNNNIKSAKSTIYQLQVEYKKNETLLKNQDLEGKKAFDFKKLMMELDNYMTKNTELNDKITKLETLKAELLSEAGTLQKDQVQVQRKLEEKNLTDFDENIVQKHKNLLNIKKRWESHIIRHEKNIELKLRFAEKDTEQYDREIEELQEKIEAHDKALQNQANNLKDANIDNMPELYNFEFGYKNNDQKASFKDNERKHVKSVDKPNRQKSNKKAEKLISRITSRNPSISKDTKIKITTKSKKEKKSCNLNENRVRNDLNKNKPEISSNKADINDRQKSIKSKEPLLKNKPEATQNKSIKNIKNAIGAFQQMKKESFSSNTVKETESTKKIQLENDKVNNSEKFKVVEPVNQKPNQEIAAKNTKVEDKKPLEMERKDSLDDIFESADKKKVEVEIKNKEVNKNESIFEDTLDKPVNTKVERKSVKKTENDDDFDFLD